MENHLVLLDTSILIEFYRKKHKERSRLFQLQDFFSHLAVSSVTEYEVRLGIRCEGYTPWDHFFTRTVSVMSFDSEVAKTAAVIQQKLKQFNKKLDISDLFIAATAILHDIPLATLNYKHFSSVAELFVV